MQQPRHYLLAAFALAVSAQALAQAPARVSGNLNTPPEVIRQQQAELAKGDPPRWSAEDTTMAARLKTIHKEIAAGLQESLGACKGVPPAERSQCARDARKIYQDEMAGAKQRAASEQ